MITTRHNSRSLTGRASQRRWCGLAFLLPSGLAAATFAEVGTESTEAPQPLPSWSVQNVEQAIERATRFMGRSAPPDSVPANAKLTILNDDETPFLCDRTNGRVVWEVELADGHVRLDLPDGRHARVRQTRFRAWIDASSGELIRIASQWPDTEAFRLVSREPREVEVMFSRNSQERYVDYVNKPVNTSFVDALAVIEKRTHECSTAIQIIGLLIYVSRLDQEAKPVWVITLRGVPPMRARPEQSGMGKRFQRRALVDAETGRLLLSTNVPHAIVIERE